jgi:hypothetical protein
MIFINGCRPTPEIIQRDYKYEKMVFENHRFTFDIHLENLKNSKKVSQLIRKLIYQNNTFDEYILFMEKEFIGDIKKEDFPPMIDDDGTEHFYHSDLVENYSIEYYNDLFIIIKYNYWAYYSGAAHGNYWFKYFIVDLTDEKILDIDELIYPIPDKLLREIIEEKYEIDYYLDENIWPPNTISLQKDGIILLWNPYSITPYSTGLIEINIQDNIIESYLAEKGAKIKKLMNTNKMAMKSGNR